MNRNVYTACPYCGKGNFVMVKDNYRQKTVVTCDEEEEGCGKDFVAVIEVSFTVKELKIEGEECGNAKAE